MTETLRLILRLAERPGGLPTFTADDTRPWCADARDTLIDQGILKEIESTERIDCDGCIEQHPLEVEIRQYPDIMLGVAMCPECGRVNIPLERLRQWQFQFSSITNCIAQAIGTTGSVVVDVPNRIVLLGKVTTPQGDTEVFLARGLEWDDASAVLARATRLNASSSPLLLAVGSAPTPGIWTSHSPARTAVLAEHATLGLEGFELDLLRAFPGGIMIESKPAKWLRVTDAGKLLLNDVSGINHAQANARVSKAATAGEFRTNGKTGHARRIDPDSFSTWRLEQREKDLAAYD